MSRPLEEVLTELLQLSCDLGRPPTYRELSERLGGASRSTIHDYVVRLRAADVLYSEHRIALRPRAQLDLARIIIGMRDAEDVARELLHVAERRASRRLQLVRNA